jgi:hypothetical protein
VALKRGRLGQSLRVTIVDEDRQALAAHAATLEPDETPEQTSTASNA